MKLLKQMETLFQAGTTSGLTDGQLLERFLQRRDEPAEAAFAALVDRHGAMVLRVCRQVLGDQHDAQDASQATFLVLARRAGSIGRRDSVACWLHGVALRVAAKLRQAESRRRARELRGGEAMTARHDNAIETDEGRESRAVLHNELGRLPESFRKPLVLCYLEGLTQEQAAAQLRCPLGTVQSRLARGRAKLKSRLTTRGFEPSAIFLGARPGTQHLLPVPEAWVEATVRLAMEFAQGKGLTLAGAGGLAALAEEVLKGMVLSKLKIVAGMVLFSAALVSGAATWARQEGNKAPPPVIAFHADKPGPEIRPEKAPEEPDSITRTVRGIVRDEQGRPVAKAWVGSTVVKRADNWHLVQPLDRIRESREPFRDEQRQIVPPGALGKYFDVRDEQGNWAPVHPANISLHEPEEGADPFGNSEALVKGQAYFHIRTGRRLWEMQNLGVEGPALRTDHDGRFEGDVTIHSFHRQAEIHVATPDFTYQGLRVVGAGDPDRPLEITLKPARKVSARLIEDLVDHAGEFLSWRAFALDHPGDDLVYIDAIRQKGAFWAGGSYENPNAGSSRDEARRFEMRLCAGRYRLVFESNTLSRLLDIVVPEGNGPISLPDIHLKTHAHLTMIGTPAAEIEATELDGRPAALTAYRGKVIVLHLWSTADTEFKKELERLIEVQKRFKDQPLVTLALHDASLTSLNKYKAALAPLRDALGALPPIRFLLDRPPVGKGTGQYGLSAGEPGAGKTRDAYDLVRGTLIIDKSGKLAAVVKSSGFNYVITFKADRNGELVYSGRTGGYAGDQSQNEIQMSSLEAALENQFGLPSSIKPAPNDSARTAPRKGPLVVSGTVIDHEGRPIAGAEIEYDGVHKATVKSGPSGEFHFTLDRQNEFAFVTIAAKELASRRFFLDFWADEEDPRRSTDSISVELNGRIRQPLQMTPGVAVTGRVVRNGKPLAGVRVGLMYDKDGANHPNRKIETKADARGFFSFPHVLPETDFWVYAALGSVEQQGAVIPLLIHTTEVGATVDIGELHVEKGRTLADRVICAGGKAPPAGTWLYVTSPHAGGLVDATLDENQRFEFHGIPDGAVYLHLMPEAKLEPVGRVPIGYRLSPANKCLDPRSPAILEGQLDHDVTNLTILLEPGEPVKVADFRDIAPTIQADFNDAKAGPITGVPPQDLPKRD
jgi:RNA polymerase sigma factor (sigma-70 family)